MYANGYVGTSQDAARIRRQQKQREEQRKDFESQQAKKREQAAGLRQFGASRAEALEAAFKSETVGLVTLEEFVQKRTTLQERLDQEQRNKELEAKAAAAEEKERRRKEKARKKPKLSFAVDEDEEEEAGDGNDKDTDKAAAGSNTAAAAAAVTGPISNGSPAAAAEGPAPSGATDTGEEQPAKRPKLSKIGKDPTVATNFLPDREREAQEEALREQLRKEWLAEQDRKKNEPLEITYSYWDGSGHRKKITVRHGDSIGTFLKAVREQLAPQFRELRAVSVDNLMYIKEDLILPHHHTFYELILNKARGKSGPLFDFSVFEDIRIVNDATMEKQDAHAGKVVERHWYERNKHIFPASRWEVYDPEVTYDKYTIKG